MNLNDIPTAQTERQIEMFHKNIPEFGIVTFIELGAFMGGLTYELHDKYPNMILHSFDIGGYLDPKVREWRKIIHIMDVFHPDTVEFIRGLIINSPGPVFLFCDNGNKIAEFDLYYPLLRTGDYVQVHDYPRECTQEFVDRVNTYLDLEMVNAETYTQDETALWKKINDVYAVLTPEV